MEELDEMNDEVVGDMESSESIIVCGFRVKKVCKLSASYLEEY